MSNRVLDLGNRLENILCNYLDCDCHEFGVKSNDNLIYHDWKSPMNFALGHKYAQSGHNDAVKEKIEDFLGYTLGNLAIDHCIDGIIKDNKENSPDGNFSDADEAYETVSKIIDEFEKILNM